MLFASIRDLSKNVSRFIDKKDVVIITKYGKPIRALIDMDEEEFEDFIIARQAGVQKDVRHALVASEKNRNLSLPELRKRFRSRK